MGNINIKIRAYLRANPHFTDDMVADHFNVSLRSVSANKSHITMGTDTDNPQARAAPVRSTTNRLSLIKNKGFELMIDTDGQFIRMDFVTKGIRKLTDDQAKAVMLTQLS
jgi:DNA repair photolyase